MALQPEINPAKRRIRWCRPHAPGWAVVSKLGLYTVLVTGPTGCTSTATILVTGTECR